MRASEFERRHLGVVLPRGVVRGLRELFDGDPSGGLRALAIVIGLISSAAGFALASLDRVLSSGAR